MLPIKEYRDYNHSEKSLHNWGRVYQWAGVAFFAIAMSVTVWATVETDHFYVGVIGAVPTAIITGLLIAMGTDKVQTANERYHERAQSLQ